jgi:hypothetical protein
MAFLCPVIQVFTYYQKGGHSCSFPHSFQLIIHSHTVTQRYLKASIKRRMNIIIRPLRRGNQINALSGCPSSSCARFASSTVELISVECHVWYRNQKNLVQI